MLAGMLIVLQQAAIAHPAAPPPPIAISPAPVITPAETLPRGPMPKNGPSGWIQTSDYPAMAVKNGRSGTTRFMVSVDAKGAITNCVVVSTSGSAALDRATCDLIRARATFNPALDNAGKPVSGSYTNQTRWVLPPPGTVPQPGEFQFHFVVENDGRQTECKVEKATGTMEGRVKVVGDGCPAVHFREPYKDAQGNPVRRRVTIIQSVIVEPAP
jgi:protein TonB